MPGVERLEKVKCFASANFTNQDAIGPVPERGADQISDGDGWQARLLPARFESHEIGFVHLNFSGVLNQDDPLAITDERGERCQ
jgi:hypothetical protein